MKLKFKINKKKVFDDEIPENTSIDKVRDLTIQSLGFRSGSPEYEVIVAMTKAYRSEGMVQVTSIIKDLVAKKITFDEAIEKLDEIMNGND